MEPNEDICFTVVVPVYNIEKFVGKCVKSIINQTYKNLEIILVDDGSKDDSGKICDAFAADDARIKAVHKVNAGLGMARNTGIENATGDYIAFIDGDDVLDPRLFEVAAKYLSTKKYDIFAYGITTFVDEKQIAEAKLSNKHTEYLGDAVQNTTLPEVVYLGGTDKGLDGSACTKIISMELIRSSKFRFVSERVFISEDYYSNLFLFKYAKSVLSIPDNLYFYRKNNVASLTSTYRDDRFEKCTYQYFESIKLAEEFGYNDLVKKNLGLQYFGNIQGAFDLILNCSKFSRKEKTKKLKEIISDERFQEIAKRLAFNGSEPYKRVLVFAIRHRLNWFAVFLLRLKRCIKKVLK